MKNLSIIIIDMQNKFKSCIDNYNKLVEAHKNLINFGKKNNLPIFYLEYQTRGSYRDPQIMTFSEIKNELFNIKKLKELENIVIMNFLL
jgi:predicted transcriptional regulator